MTKKVNKKTTKDKNQKIVKGTIEKTDCKAWLGKKSLQIQYEDKLYIANIEFVTEKMNSLPAHIHLGVMTDDGIENETNAWLTIKDKAVYFTPSKDVLLVTSKTGLIELLNTERDELDFGIFK